MSVSEWREYTVKELVDLKMLDKPLDGNHGGMHPKSSDYVTSGIPFIMANDLKDGKVDYDCCNFITEKQAKTLKKGFAKPGDVLLTHKATMGRTAIVDDSYPYIVLTPQVTYYRVLKGIDNKYLKYYFDSKDFQELLFNWAGTGSTRAYLGITEQLKLPIILPPLPEQKAIAATLSALDDMIGLNNQINKTLEEMAQAIFKSWFVDFEPFKDGEFEESELGMIPKGWNVKRIDQIDIEITDYVANGSFAALKENVTLCDEEDYAVFIRNVDLKANSFNKFVDKKSYEFLRKTKLWGGEVIISNVGDVGSVFRCPLLAKPMTLGNNMIMLKSISPVNYNLFLYILFKYSYGIELIKSITSGSAQPKFNKTDFRNLKIIVPPKEVIQLFNNIVEKLYRIVDEGIVENQLLSTVRDTLLPKLMSGEIRVPVEGAM